MGMTPEFLANLKKATENFKGKGDYAKLISKAGDFYDFDIEIVSPDPNQPRKNFDETALQELADDLKKNGLIQPIVVREDPDNVGKFIVVAGERRLKAAKLAGFKKIRSILSTYDNSQLGYVQIAENAKRDNLKFYEMAEFIVSRADAGESQADIAEKLGLSKTKVSEYMSWKDAPNLLKESKEKFNAIRAFYDAVKLYDEYQSEVTTFINESDSITKSEISALRKRLKHPELEQQPETIEETANAPAFDEISSNDAASITDDDSENSIDEPSNESNYDADSESSQFEDVFSGETSHDSTGSNESTFQEESLSNDSTSFDEESEAPSETDFASETTSKKLKHPVLVGTVDGREAEIVMEKPSTDGMVKIKYEDGSFDEVLCENFILNRIYEA